MSHMRPTRLPSLPAPYLAYCAGSARDAPRPIGEPVRVRTAHEPVSPLPSAAAFPRRVLGFAGPLRTAPAPNATGPAVTF